MNIKISIIELIDLLRFLDSPDPDQLYEKVSRLFEKLSGKQLRLGIVVAQIDRG